MITPDARECPNCGIELIRTGTSATVKPECDQLHGQNGELVVNLLFWRCRDCGCRWKHGQFASVKNGEAPTGRTNVIM